jgi:CLIP-associating protein 1/2
MVDAVTLRQVLNAFLPTGGVVDRLGDNREKTREKARETLIILGGLAYRSSAASSMSSKSKEGKGPETPLMIFERSIREVGLGSKVWKTREQVREHSYFFCARYFV